jgi:uncharacterized protein (DUF58 family)
MPGRSSVGEQKPALSSAGERRWIMTPTARWWAAALAGVVVVALAVGSRQPLFLAGPVGVGAWLLGVGILTSRAMARQCEELAVAYHVAVTNPVVETTATATVSINRPAAAATLPVSLHVDTPPGVTVRDAPATLQLSATETTAETTGAVSFPLAGAFSFPQPQVTLGDPFGFYTQTVSLGSSPTVTVRERSTSIHVGQGGEMITSVYGEHTTARSGPGIVPEVIREYVPGDDFQQIDWKATARLASLYVRETEAESDRSTQLIVDHRSRMAVGDPGETMLAYARSVGSGVVRTAASQGDPLALYTVGAAGISTVVQPSTAAQTYATAASTLYRLSPVGDTDTDPSRSAATASALADRLDTSTTFGDVLRPYFDDSVSYTTRLRADPLVGAVQRAQLADRTDSLLVVITTDTDPARLTEAVSLAINRGSRVLLFVTPQCLFATAEPLDLDTVYDQYLAFEELRRTLDRHPRVTVYEVAPGARLERLLAHRRTQPTTA